MKAIEKMGLLKMDFLGLTTLTVIDDCLKLIKRPIAAKSSTWPRCRSTIAQTYREGLSSSADLRRLPV